MLAFCKIQHIFVSNFVKAWLRYDEKRQPCDIKNCQIKVYLKTIAHLSICLALHFLLPLAWLSRALYLTFPENDIYLLVNSFT